MAAPRPKRFHEIHARTWLAAAYQMRHACIAAAAVAPINSPAYRAIGAVNKALTAAAEALTGEECPLAGPPQTQGLGKGWVRPHQQSPAIQAALLAELRAEFPAGPDEEMQDLAARLTRIVLAVPLRDEAEEVELG